jgi:hypothetical protein
MKKTITNTDRKLAGFCAGTRPVWKKARKDQKGSFYRFVKFTESGVCPACRAYEKTYGKKAHEPISQS